MQDQPPPEPGLPPETAAIDATAEAGLVLLDGPRGLAITLTPDAADRTADNLRQAAGTARQQGPRPV